MKIPLFLRIALLLLVPQISFAVLDEIPETDTPKVIVNTGTEPITPGKFKPTWASLKQYQPPEWFRNAKFGIWACFGPQSQAEDGDWYARGMYEQGSKQNIYHLAHYGPPSQFGFKDVIHTWKADQFDPEKLLALYKRAGAQYFFAMANHHDNFDMWDSKYQPWECGEPRAEEGYHRPLRKGSARSGPAVRRQCPRGARMELVRDHAKQRQDRPAGRRSL
jgi:hypothetical protein